MDFIIRNVYKKQDISSTIKVIGTCNGRQVVIRYCHLVDSRMYDLPTSSSSCLFGNLIYEKNGIEYEKAVFVIRKGNNTYRIISKYYNLLGRYVLQKERL